MLGSGWLLWFQARERLLPATCDTPPTVPRGGPRNLASSPLITDSAAADQTDDECVGHPSITPLSLLWPPPCATNQPPASILQLSKKETVCADCSLSFSSNFSYPFTYLCNYPLYFFSPISPFRNSPILFLYSHFFRSLHSVARFLATPAKMILWWMKRLITCKNNVLLLFSSHHLYSDLKNWNRYFGLLNGFDLLIFWWPFKKWIFSKLF